MNSFTMQTREQKCSLRLGFLAAILIGAICTAAPAQDLRFFRIGTAAPGGTYHPVGGLISNAISNPLGSRPCDKGGSCGVPGFIASAKSTKGSVANVKAIGGGNLESGFGQADVAYWAFRGTGPFRESGAIDNLRAIANLFPESVHVVVRKDSGITRIPDLKGKRVSLGEKGSGTFAESWAILDVFGLTKDNLSATYLKPVPASIALREGKIDAFFIVAGAPIGAIEELSRTAKIGLVPIDGREADILLTRFPFFGKGKIPGGTYGGVEETPTVHVGALWLVAAETDSDLVYGITRALWHPKTKELLENGHPLGNAIRLDSALDRIAVPLHPGAARYYFEIGRYTSVETELRIAPRAATPE